MANVNSISSNSYSSSSIYGSRNILSGLASGLDTETMIENSVSGYKTKVTQLQQEQTKLEWKQDAYRNITDKLINLSRNYTSYTSSTNLYSESFFGQTTTGISGSNASAVSATGKAGSTVEINAITQLATSAKYTASASVLGLGGNNATGKQIDISKLFNDDGKSVLNSDSALTVTVDGVAKSYKLSELEGADASTLTKNSEQDDANAFQNRLAAALQDAVNADFGTGKVSISAKDGQLSVSATGNSLVKLSSNVNALGLGGSGLTNYIDNNKSIGELLEQKGIQNFFTTENAMEGKEIDTTKTGVEVTVGGVKKTLNYDTDGNLVDTIDGKNYRVTSSGSLLYDFKVNGTSVGQFTESDSLNSVLNTINRSDTGVTASFSTLSGEFQFASRETGAAGKIDFGAGLASSLFSPVTDSSKRTLGDVFGENIDWHWLYFGTPDDRISLRTSFTAESTLDDLIQVVNSNDGIDVEIQYDDATGAVSLGSKSGTRTYDTSTFSFMDVKGAAMTLDKTFAAPDLLQEGKDAKLNVTVNGKAMELTRSSNLVDIDGMSVTLKNTFNVDENGKMEKGEAITFNHSTNSDSILEGIKSFVKDYNDVMKAIHDAYTTQPAEKNSSTHARYEPLTEDDKDDMSESAIARYEEKAKQGILFGDTDLSMLYGRMTNLLSSGNLAQELRDIGITTAYDSSSRLETLEIDEDKLRAALDGDAEKVASIFTRTDKDANGNSTGLMAKMKDTLDLYASTSYSSPGVLVRKAGTTMSSSSLLKNDMQDQLNSVQEKVESWQTKMSAKIDYYTRQFTALEKLMNTMNSQSSMLSGLMGY